MSNEPQRNFDINMNFNGLTPSTGGGGQFPLTGVDGAPAYHQARIADMTKEVNSKSTGEVVKVKLEGVSQAVLGLNHTVTINIAHQDPQVSKRGAQDMFALVYAATGQTQIGNAGLLLGKLVGCTIRPDTSSDNENQNRTRLDHFVFPDGRELVINGQLQPVQAQAGNFNGGGGFNSGGNNGQGNSGFSTGGQGNQNNQPQNNNPPQNDQGQGQSQGFNSGASVQNNGGFSTGTMPNPNGNQNPNNNGGGNGYNGAPNFNNGGNNGQGQGDRPNWSQGA